MQAGMGSLGVRLSKIETLFVLIVAIPLLGTFFPVESYLSAATLANPLGTPVEVGKTTTLCLIALYALILWLYAQQSRRLLAAIVENWPLFALVAWIMLSALWSDTPGQSINRSGRVLLCVLFSIYIARCCDSQAVIKIICYAILIGIVGSAIVTIGAPGLSRVVDVRGAWRGAYQHKNVLGSVAAFGVMFGAYAYGTRAVSRQVSVFLVLGGVIFILLSNSITALLAVMVTGAFVLFVLNAAPMPDGRRVLALIAVFASVALLVSLLTAIPALLQVTGRDMSLTGRTDVWDFANRMIAVKPFWGWGHGVWSTPVFQSYVIQELQWSAPHAHNTWIDFRLQLGLPGFLLGVFVAFCAIKRAFVATLVARDSEYLLWIGVIMFDAIRCNTETMFIDPATNDLFWFALAFARLPMLARRPSVAQRHPPFSRQVVPTAVELGREGA